MFYGSIDLLGWKNSYRNIKYSSPEQPVRGWPPSVFVPLAVRVPGDERGLGQVHGHCSLQGLPPLIG